MLSSIASSSEFNSADLIDNNDIDENFSNNNITSIVNKWWNDTDIRKWIIINMILIFLIVLLLLDWSFLFHPSSHASTVAAELYTVEAQLAAHHHICGDAEEEELFDKETQPPTRWGYTWWGSSLAHGDSQWETVVHQLAQTSASSPSSSSSSLSLPMSFYWPFSTSVAPDSPPPVTSSSELSLTPPAVSYVPGRGPHGEKLSPLVLVLAAAPGENYEFARVAAKADVTVYVYVKGLSVPGGHQLEEGDRLVLIAISDDVGARECSPLLRHVVYSYDALPIVTLFSHAHGPLATKHALQSIVALNNVLMHRTSLGFVAGHMLHGGPKQWWAEERRRRGLPKDAPITEPPLLTRQQRSLIDAIPFESIVKSVFDKYPLGSKHGTPPPENFYASSTFQFAVQQTKRFTINLLRSGFASFPQAYQMTCLMEGSRTDAMSSPIFAKSFYKRLMKYWNEQIFGTPFIQSMHRSLEQSGADAYSCGYFHCCTELMFTRERVRSVPHKVWSDTLGVLVDEALQDRDQAGAHAPCEYFNKLFPIALGMSPFPYGFNAEDIVSHSAQQLFDMVATSGADPLAVCPLPISYKMDGSKTQELQKLIDVKQGNGQFSSARLPCFQNELHYTDPEETIKDFGRKEAEY